MEPVISILEQKLTLCDFVLRGHGERLYPIMDIIGTAGHVGIWIVTGYFIALPAQQRGKKWR
jgi:hypothetical protein